MLISFFFFQLDTRSNLEKGDLNWENPSIRLGSRQVCGIIFLINDLCGSIHCMYHSRTGGSALYIREISLSNSWREGQ